MYDKRMQNIPLFQYFQNFCKCKHVFYISPSVIEPVSSNSPSVLMSPQAPALQKAPPKTVYHCQCGHYFSIEMSGVWMGFFVFLDEVVIVSSFMSELIVIFGRYMSVSVSEKQQLAEKQQRAAKTKTENSLNYKAE